MSQAKLGSYWAPAHTGNEYKDVLAAIGGPIRILEPDVQHMSDASVRTSDEIWPRLWRIDDNNYKVLDDVIADPEGSGERLALALIAECDKMHQQAAEREIPFPAQDRLRLSGINEPPVWTDLKDELIRHEVRFLDTLTAHRYKSLALRMSVGHPADLKASNGNPNWDDFLPVYEAIKRSDGLSMLELHEYWYWTGPQDGWTWYAGRHWRCAWDVDIAIGEAGVDNFVDANRWNQESHRRRGYQGNVSNHDYAYGHFGWYYAHVDHSRVKVILPYLLDYQANQWDSFDIFPARAEFISWWRETQGKPVEVQKMTYEVNLPAIWGNDAPDAPVQPDKPSTPVTVDPGKQVAASRFLTWWFVGEMGRVLGIDPDLAEAFLTIESGIRFGQPIPADPMIIRFEPHIFKQYVHPEIWARHFQIGSPIWTGHKFRTGSDQPWQDFHGNQAKEHEVLNLAYRLDKEGAYRSISMGAGQIMGFNFKTVGYDSAAQMFAAYNDPERGPFAQVVGFYAYCVNRDGLLAALRAKDFDTMARLYNGEGQVAHYSNLIRNQFLVNDAD